MVKRIVVEESSPTVTAERVARWLIDRVNDAFASKSDQDIRRRQGCQPKYIIGPTLPRPGYATSQLFISLVEPDLNSLALQLLNSHRNTLGEKWIAEICRNPPAHRRNPFNTQVYSWSSGQNLRQPLKDATLEPSTASPIALRIHTGETRTVEAYREEDPVSKADKITKLPVPRLCIPRCSPNATETTDSAPLQLHSNSAPLQLHSNSAPLQLHPRKDDPPRSTSRTPDRPSFFGQTSRKRSRGATASDTEEANSQSCTGSIPRQSWGITSTRESSPEWNDLPTINPKRRAARANNKLRKRDAKLAKLSAKPTEEEALLDPQISLE